MEEGTGVSLSEALLLAGVAPTLGFVGIVLTLIFTSRVASKERESQKQLERNGLLRQERISVYRDLIAAANVVLVNSMEVMLHRQPTRTGVDIEWKTVRQRWVTEMASARLVAGMDVVDAAENIDQVAIDRYHPSVEFMLEEVLRSPKSQDGEAIGTSWVVDGRLQVWREHTIENQTLLEALTIACRESLVALNDEGLVHSDVGRSDSAQSTRRLSSGAKND